MSGMLHFLFDLIFSEQCLRCGCELDCYQHSRVDLIPTGWPEYSAGFFRGSISHRFMRKLEIPARLMCPDCWFTLKPAVPPFSPFHLDHEEIAVISPFVTNENLLNLVRFLKYREGKSAAASLSWWMAQSLNEWMGLSGNIFDHACLVPVPLHPSRERARGYNQAALLAEYVSRFTGIPVLDAVIERAEETRSQAITPRHQRADNVRGAFRLVKAEGIRGKELVLVDDLVTSGATAQACCNTLYQSCPGSVLVLSAGRASALVSEVSPKIDVRIP